MIPWIAARDIKTILIWNSAHRIETAAFGFGRQTFFQHGCDIKECVVFDNKTSILPLEEYDAIIIHMHELWQTQMPNFTRRAHQRLIFLSQESPTTIPCPRNGMNWLSFPKCYDELETKYKFYLSFENSICNDYVTEKFFEIMNHNIVPIVYGGANYSQFAPHHSYINALDFTPEKLAQYLLLLDANDNFYNEYFWWKDHYRVETGVEQMARHGFCDLCKKLHQEEGVTKFYSDLVSEWHTKTQCKQMSNWETSTTTQSTTTTTPAAITTVSPDPEKLHQQLVDYLMNQLESVGIVDPNVETPVDNSTRTANTSNVILNPKDLDALNSVNVDSNMVDIQQMQYLRDYVMDQLQPFGIVDPNENAVEP
ncbi:hypothetical protein DAPPUDRAFT_198878 [Daphnia pulex]|uniref:Fucosyltransferase n=1 Tax=Daphnia pulex TaxID=6669 RepID=E9GVG6_DAPPU|nr:hypothetical protein DAPPUDRAFT_198878 [Daphnia pulex]|eukprot:EFX76411.1 hypothetical protein DAPPUDRAFT_198878 [Daphnia pulex]